MPFFACFQAKNGILFLQLLVAEMIDVRKHPLSIKAILGLFFT